MAACTNGLTSYKYIDSLVDDSSNAASKLKLNSSINFVKSTFTLIIVYIIYLGSRTIIELELTSTISF